MAKYLGVSRVRPRMQPVPRFGVYGRGVSVPSMGPRAFQGIGFLDSAQDAAADAIYEAFYTRMKASIPEIVQEISPYLRQEVQRAVPRDLIASVMGQAYEEVRQAKIQAVVGGIFLGIGTAALTWALLRYVD